MPAASPLMSNMNGPGTIPSSAFPPAGPADHNETFEPWVRKAALSLGSYFLVAQ